MRDHISLRAHPKPSWNGSAFTSRKLLKLLQSTWERSRNSSVATAAPDPAVAGPGRRKHMKFSKFGRATLAAVLSLGVAAAFTACGPNGYNNTVDYVYVTNSKNSPGQINVYYTDARSGALTQITGSPFPSGGSDPVGLVTSPNFKFLYVVNKGQGSAGSGIVEFSIG